MLLEIENVGKVKFHFRYMAAVTSVDPLIIDTDKVFWVGCANKYIVTYSVGLLILSFIFIQCLDLKFN